MDKVILTFIFNDMFPYMYVYRYIYIHIQYYYTYIYTCILTYIIITTNIVVSHINNTLNRSSQGHRFYKKKKLKVISHYTPKFRTIYCPTAFHLNKHWYRFYYLTLSPSNTSFLENFAVSCGLLVLNWMVLLSCWKHWIPNLVIRTNNIKIN